jgi:hypothetical protein
MNHVSPVPGPPRVPPVEPELLASAIFLFSEYLERLAAEAPPADEDAEAETPPEIETRAVLDLFAEEIGTSVPVTLALYLRTTALFRLLAASPSLARLAMEAEPGGRLSEDALLAAARLDLRVTRTGEKGVVEFDAREFREALRQA